MLRHCTKWRLFKPGFDYPSSRPEFTGRVDGPWTRVHFWHQSTQYLVDLCLPVSDVASGQHLRSASRRLLVLPRHRLRTYGRRAFSVAGPPAWNSLPDNLRDSNVSRDSFYKLLKSYLFTFYWNIERIRGFTRMRYTNLLTYLLTYDS